MLRKKLSLILAIAFLLAIVPAASADNPDGRDYIMQSGDSLSKIAAAEYGDPLAYPAIVAATNEKAETDSSYVTITDANRVEVGCKIFIPKASSTSTGALAGQTLTTTGDPVQDALQALGYADMKAFVTAWGLKVAANPASPNAGEIDAAEITNCPFEKVCLRILREKDMNAVIRPFNIKNPTSCMQDGWMDDPAQRVQFGRTTPVTAKGSGVPAGWSGLVQGVTIRSCTPGVPLVVTAPVTPTKTTSQTVTAPATPTTWTQDDVKTFFKLSSNATLGACNEKGPCFALGSTDGKPVSITTGVCHQDGYRSEGFGDADGNRTGIPSNWTGQVDNATLRPCL